MNQYESIYDYGEKRHVSIRRVTDFTSLINPLGPSEKAKQAMRKALKNVGLPPDDETRYLRRFISKKEGIPADSILFGHGSSQLLDAIFLAVKPKRALMFPPVSPRYQGLVAKYGAEPIALSPSAFDEDQGSPDLSASAFGTSDLVLLQNPHFLTGKVVTASVVADLADRIVRAGKVLVLDEGLLEYTSQPSQVARTVESDNLIVLRTFSLFHALAGLRLGYCVASPKTIDEIGRAVPPSPVSNVAAAAALASMRDAGFKRRTLKFVEEEKEYLKQKLGQAEEIEVIDGPCNFLLIRVRASVDEIDGPFDRRNMKVRMIQDNEEGMVLLSLPVRRRRENARFAKTLLAVLRNRRLQKSDVQNNR